MEASHKFVADQLLIEMRRVRVKARRRIRARKRAMEKTNGKKKSDVGHERKLGSSH